MQRAIQSLIITALFFSSFISVSQSGPTVADLEKCMTQYNQELAQANRLTADLNIWITTSLKENAAQRVVAGTKKVEAIKGQLTSSIGNLQSLPAIEGKTDLKDTMVQVFQEQLAGMNSAEMLVILNYDHNKGVDELIKFYKSVSFINALDKKGKERVDTQVERERTRTGAEFIMVSNEQNAQVDRMNLLVDYVNSFAAESAILTKYYNVAIHAIEKGELAKSKASIMAMKKYAEKVLPKLEAIGGFKGNSSLVNSQIEKAKFLKGEGFTSLRVMTIEKATVNKYADKELTREEHNVYAESANKYNAANQALQQKMLPLVNHGNRYRVELINANYR